MPYNKLNISGARADVLSWVTHEPDAVMLMFDRSRSAIGIIRTPVDRRGSYRLRDKQKKTCHSRIVNAAKFCRHFDILPPATIAFKDPTINDDGILILEMDHAEVVRGRSGNLS